jgi:hypothetical protein
LTCAQAGVCRKLADSRDLRKARCSSEEMLRTARAVVTPRA